MDEGGNSNDVRKTKEIDRLVGLRVRVRRIFLGITQDGLAEMLGITFQQIQKYEKGVNRVSASRLFELSQALRAPIGYFFEDVAGTVGATTTKCDVGDPSFDALPPALLPNEKAIELMKAFSRIKDESVRRAIVNQIRAIADLDGSEVSGPKSQ